MNLSYNICLVYVHDVLGSLPFLNHVSILNFNHKKAHLFLCILDLFHHVLFYDTRIFFNLITFSDSIKKLLYPNTH